MSGIELEGMDAIINRLSELGRKSKEVEDKALNLGATVILEEAKDNLKRQVERRTGKLEEGLEISPSKTENNKRYVLVGIQKNDNSEIYYGKFIEWSASAHLINVEWGGRSITLHHPGIAARPFLGPAYETKKDEAKNVIKLALKKALGL